MIGSDDEDNTIEKERLKRLIKYNIHTESFKQLEHIYSISNVLNIISYIYC